MDVFLRIVAAMLPFELLIASYHLNRSSHHFVIHVDIEPRRAEALVPSQRHYHLALTSEWAGFVMNERRPLCEDTPVTPSTV